MRIIIRCLALVFVLVGRCIFAQTISGSITDKVNNEPLVGVNISMKGTLQGTISGLDGNFILFTEASFPFVLVISSIGYTSQEIEITSDNASDLKIVLEESVILGQEVVISASRVEENILKSPVTIQKLDILDIRESPAVDFYDALKNLNGVDYAAQSLSFKSINPRGFGANGNTRVVQLVDGVDNEAPGLNFAAGNLFAINELDLESVELISGPASALYGPNALQGILLLDSKSPFEYQGVSAYTKMGLNHIDGEDEDPSFYQDYSLRYAKSFNDKVAFKVSASYLSALDFVANDRRHLSSINGVDDNGNIKPTNSRTYNGVNVYGDFDFNFSALPSSPTVDGIRTLLPTGADGNFNPTGFAESAFVDNRVTNLKTSTALHFRPTEKLELIGQFNYSAGNSVYTANDRFIIDNFSIYSAKLEARGTDFYARAFITRENSGDTYAANTLTSLINQQNYLPAYVQSFAFARGSGADITAAHAIARTTADSLQKAYAPGTAVFQKTVDSLRGRSLAQGGSGLNDQSAFYQADFNYNLSKLTDAIDIIVGGNIRSYALNSGGNLFAQENDGSEVSYLQYGGFVQFKKTFLDERLSLQASGRYDKNPNFEGQFSPRASATYTLSDKHNFRASFQNGFRLPSNQEQFIDLDVVTRRLIGANKILIDRYKIKTNPVYNTAVLANLRNQVNAGTITAAQAAGQLVREAKTLENFKTEKVATFEFGYKGLLLDSKLLIDAHYFFNTYTDLVLLIDVTQAVPNGLKVQPTNFDASSAAGKEQIISQSVPLQRYGFRSNLSQTLRSQGGGLSLEYSFNNGLKLGADVSYNKINADDAKNAVEKEGGLIEFNTPEWKYNLSIADREVVKDVGFNLIWRWQQAFLWESAYGVGVVPAFGTLDAQVSYHGIDKVILKLGASNVLNERYTTGIGNPTMGAIYFLQLTFDQFLN